MKLEHQVIPLELAKRLKSLGVKQESLFWWEQIKIAGKNEWKKEWELGFNNNSPHYRGGRTIAAFTVAELGEMLPAELPGNWLLQMAPAFKNIKAWVLWYEDTESPEKMTLNGNHWTISADTEAEARGRMLAYLIENKLLTPNEEV